MPLGWGHPPHQYQKGPTIGARRPRRSGGAKGPRPDRPDTETPHPPHARPRNSAKSGPTEPPPGRRPRRGGGGSTPYYPGDDGPRRALTGEPPRHGESAATPNFATALSPASTTPEGPGIVAALSRATSCCIARRAAPRADQAPFLEAEPRRTRVNDRGLQKLRLLARSRKSQRVRPSHRRRCGEEHRPQPSPRAVLMIRRDEPPSPRHTRCHRAVTQATIENR